MIPSTTPAREMTEWFPADVKPVHVGVYQACMEVIEDRLGATSIEYGFAKWDGQRWGKIFATASAADWWETQGSQRKAWRGLKEPT